MHQELYKGISINQYSCIKFLVNKIVRKYHIFSSICFLWPEGIAIKKWLKTWENNDFLSKQSQHQNPYNILSSREWVILLTFPKQGWSSCM